MLCYLNIIYIPLLLRSLPPGSNTVCGIFWWICLGNVGLSYRHVSPYFFVLSHFFVFYLLSRALTQSFMFNTRNFLISLDFIWSDRGFVGIRVLCNHLDSSLDPNHGGVPRVPSEQPHRCHLPSAWCPNSGMAIAPTPSF